MLQNPQYIWLMEKIDCNIVRDYTALLDVLLCFFDIYIFKLGCFSSREYNDKVYAFNHTSYIAF